MKECSRCHKMLDSSFFYKDKRAKDGLYSDCRVCRSEYATVSNEYQREYRRKNPEKIKQYQKTFKERHPERTRSEKLKKYLREYMSKRRATDKDFKLKDLAREKTRNAVRTRNIFKQPCVICNDINSEAHHEDYSKPLEVIWLCKKHHCEIHHNLIN